MSALNTFDFFWELFANRNKKKSKPKSEGSGQNGKEREVDSIGYLDRSLERDLIRDVKKLKKEMKQLKNYLYDVRVLQASRMSGVKSNTASDQFENSELKGFTYVAPFSNGGPTMSTGSQSILARDVLRKRFDVFRK